MPTNDEMKTSSNELERYGLLTDNLDEDARPYISQSMCRAFNYVVIFPLLFAAYTASVFHLAQAAVKPDSCLGANERVLTPYHYN
jgi:hypothetical protein